MWWAAIPYAIKGAQAFDQSVAKAGERPEDKAPTRTGVVTPPKVDLLQEREQTPYWSPQTNTPPQLMQQRPPLFAEPQQQRFAGGPTVVSGPLGERPAQPETYLTPEVKVPTIERARTPYEEKIAEQEQERYKRLIEKTGGWWG